MKKMHNRSGTCNYGATLQYNIQRNAWRFQQNHLGRTDAFNQAGDFNTTCVVIATYGSIDLTDWQGAEIEIIEHSGSICFRASE